MRYTKMIARYNLEADGRLTLVDVHLLETKQTAEGLQERYSSDLGWSMKKWADNTLEFERRTGATVSIISSSPIPPRVEKIICTPKDN